MNTFRHVILTRFNVKIEQAPPASSEWFEHRFSLFERFCLPSVEAQTCTNFDWLVFCDPDIPTSFKARLGGYSRVLPIYFRNVFNQGMVRAAVSEIARGSSHLITTRLDNDDAISRTFVECVQGNFHGQSFEFLNFTNGYIWEDGRIWSGRHTSNAFISLVERVQDYLTVYCGNHMELNQRGPVAQISEPAAWLQVVHGRNLSNRAWGTPEREIDLYGKCGIKP